MSESMGGNLFADTCNQSLLFYHIEYRYAAERPAETIQKGSVVKFPAIRFRTGFQIIAECLYGHSSHRHKTLLIAFTYYPHKSLL